MDTQAAHSIFTTLGQNNLLLIAPHGRETNSQPETGANLAKLTLELTRQLGCYAVINNKYKQTIINCFDVESVKSRKKVTDAYLLQIKRFKDEISDNGLLPLILIFQVADSILPDGQKILFGYGQGERGAKDKPHNPSISPSLLAKFRVGIEDQHLKTEISDTASSYCGREPQHINQLFRQKNYLDGFYDPEVRSLLLTLSPDLLSDDESTRSTSLALAKAFKPFIQEMSLVRKIKIENIDIQDQDDFQYIFRIPNDNRYGEIARESYIDELAASIKRNGLLHPLVLLQKENGSYRILCGFRRFQAIKRISQKWVEAKIFQEQDFNTEDFFNISLAENTKRRNLNPIEIGNFLESASKTMELNNTMLAERFGETLGIGAPGKQVSHSTIHKYRKVYQIRVRGESPDIINDIINDNLPFAIAAEILAPMKDPKDRDCFYLEIVKPLSPTRPQLVKILNLLQEFPEGIQTTIKSDRIQQVINSAINSSQQAGTFIRLLQQQLSKKDENTPYPEKIKEIRNKYFGPRAGKKDFDVKQDKRKKDGGLEVNFRITKDNYQNVIAQVQKVLDDEQLFS